MPLKDFLRFPGEDEAAKFDYARTPTVVASIVIAAVAGVFFLALYASLRTPLLLTLAGVAAGVSVGLWLLTRTD